LPEDIIFLGEFFGDVMMHILIGIDGVGEATVMEIGGGVETGGEVLVESVSEVGIAIDVGLEMALIPYECLFHITPDYKFFKIFGCECWPFIQPYNSSKLSFRSTSCVFIGYSKNHLGYKCLHIPSGRVYIAQDMLY
jgi:hypothetical protein